MFYTFIAYLASMEKKYNLLLADGFIQSDLRNEEHNKQLITG